MKELIRILDKFNLSPLHDYDNKDNYISMLGIFEEDLILLRSMLPKGWITIEKRRNPDNDFLRVDIVKVKEEIFDLILEWQKLYQQVNSKTAPNVEYNNGWFLIENTRPTKLRRSKFEEMILILKGRIK